MKFTGGAGVYGIALVRLLFAYIEISAGELLVAVLINLLYQLVVPSPTSSSPFKH